MKANSKEVDSINYDPIESIDGALLEAFFAGGRILRVLSRTNEKTKVTASVAIVEMAKDSSPFHLPLTSLNDNNKYWKYLVFHNTPDIKKWWHSSSNNLTKRENLQKIWDEWSELQYYIN